MKIDTNVNKFGTNSGFLYVLLCLNEYVPRLLQDPPGHHGGSRKSGNVRNLARFPHFTAQLAASVYAITWSTRGNFWVSR